MIHAAFDQLAGLPRWVLWRAEERGGKPTKVPYQSSGARASSTNPKTWRLLAHVLPVTEHFDGVGCVLGDLGDGRWLFGIDLDACLLADGLAPWAADIVEHFRTYSEVSPSGVGIKIFAITTDPPRLPRNKIVPPGAKPNGKMPEIAVYTDKRYFTVTGRQYGDYDEIEDCTEALYWLANELARHGEHSPQLPPRVAAALLVDAQFKLLWATGEHGGGDKSRSGADAALANALRRLGCGFAEFSAALQAWHHGQDRPLPERRLHRLWDLVAGGGDGPGAEHRLAIIMAHECRTILSGREAIKGVLPSKGMAVIYGEPGCGKTFTAIAMLMAIARNIDWHGRKTRPLKVLYIAPDGGAFVQNRIVAYMRRHEIEGEAIGFAIITQPVDILGSASPAQLDELRQAIADFAASDGGFDPDIIVIDTVSRSMPGGNENSPEHMTKWIDRAHSIAPGKLVVGIHHSGKDASKGSRGHSSLKGATDCEIEVADGIITVRKLRDGQGGARFGFKLTVVELGLDEDGDVVTSCVAEETTPPADSSGLSTEAQIILQSLQRMYGRCGNATTVMSRKEINDVIDEHIGDSFIDKAGDDPKAIEQAKEARKKRRLRLFNELKRGGYITATTGTSLCTVRFLPDADDE